jgi:hypothetical protein
MHTLTKDGLAGFEIRFYDWSGHHPINDMIKARGQGVNHVTVALVYNDGTSMEFVVDMEGATVKPSALLERAYGEPLFKYFFSVSAIKSYQIQGAQMRERVIFNQWDMLFPAYVKMVNDHKTSPVWYHLLWWYTGRILPEPTNCLSLTKQFLHAYDLRSEFTATDILGLLKQVHHYHKKETS